MSGRYSLSMIIPVHNNEASLRSCLDSILPQRPGDFEVILVNNGSTDASVELCEDYRAKDPRVHVIHMEHSAPAAAYNNGLAAASGKYVHFVDAKDTLEAGAIGKITDILLQNHDIIFLDTPHPNFWDISHVNILRRLSRDIPARLWDKLIKRDVLVNQDISFAGGIVWESVDFCMKLYLHAMTYGAIDFTYYNRHPEEVDRDVEGVFGKVILTLSKWAGPAETTYEEFSSVVHHWMAAMYCDLLIPMYHQLPPGSRGLYKPGMSDFQWLLDVRKSRKDQVAKMLYIVVGLFLTSHVITRLEFDNA